MIHTGPLLNHQILRCVEHLCDSLCGSTCLGENRKHAGHEQNRVQDDRHVGHKCHDDTRLCQTAVYTNCSIVNHQNHSKIQEKAHDRIHGAHDHAGLPLLIHHFFINRSKLLPFCIRLRQCLDNTDTGCVLSYQTDKTVQRLLHSSVHGNSAAAEQIHKNTHWRDHRQHNHRQTGIHGQCHCQSSNQHDWLTNAKALHHSKHLVNVVGIRCRTGNQGRHGKRFLLPRRQEADAAVELQPDPLRCVSRNQRCHPVCNNVSYQRQNCKQDHYQAPGKNDSHIAQRNDIINHNRQCPRNQQFDNGSCYFDHEAYRHSSGIGLQAAENLFHLFSFSLLFLMRKV